MEHPIDAALAWKLVRAVPRGPAAGGTVVRIPPEREGGAWLRVDPAGRWRASGRVSAEAADVFELYLPLQLRAGWVVGQVGQSLDGRIATRAGHSHWITGPEDIRRLHRLRALADAVVVGAGTVEADDPRLTVREAEGANPVRVVLDPDGRLSPTHRVFSDGAAPTLVVRREGAGTGRFSGDAAVMTLPVDGPLGFHPARLIRALGDRGLERILVEGGGVTISRFLRAGALDRLHVAVAPLIIGSGRPAVTLDPIETLDGALRPPCRRFVLGEDVLFDLDLGGGG